MLIAAMAMHVTNKNYGNMTQLHDKYLLTSLYTKKASNLSKQADFVDIHMNKTMDIMDMFECTYYSIYCAFHITSEDDCSLKLCLSKQIMNCYF